MFRPAVLVQTCPGPPSGPLPTLLSTASVLPYPCEGCHCAETAIDRCAVESCVKRRLDQRSFCQNREPPGSPRQGDGNTDNLADKCADEECQTVVEDNYELCSIRKWRVHTDIKSGCLRCACRYRVRSPQLQQGKIQAAPGQGDLDQRSAHLRHRRVR